jgi:hypothetical protein
MNTPAPVKNNLFVPSIGGAGNGIGAALAVIFIINQHQHGIDYPAGGEAAIAVVISWVTGYVTEILNCVLKRFGIDPPSN